MQQRKRFRHRVDGQKRNQQTIRFTRLAMALISKMMAPGVLHPDGSSMGDVIETAIRRFEGPS